MHTHMHMHTPTNTNTNTNTTGILFCRNNEIQRIFDMAIDKDSVATTKHYQQKYLSVLNRLYVGSFILPSILYAILIRTDL